MRRYTAYFPACSVLALLGGVLAEDFYERSTAPHTWRDDPIILPAPPIPAKEPAKCKAWGVHWPCQIFKHKRSVEV